MDKNHEKYKIVGMLLNDPARDLKSIAKELDVSYGKVVRYNRELKEAQDNQTLNEFIDMDDAVFRDLVANAKSQAPATLEGEITESLDRLSEAKTGLDILSTELQSTARQLNVRIRMFSHKVEHVSELDALADALCKLQNAFFNKQSTTVNIQNNLSSAGGQPYGAFLSDKPED